MLANETLAWGVSGVQLSGSGEGLGLWGPLDLDPPQQRRLLKNVGDEVVAVGEGEPVEAGLGVPVSGDLAAGEAALHLAEQGEGAFRDVVGDGAEEAVPLLFKAVVGLNKSQKETKACRPWTGAGKTVDENVDLLHTQHECAGGVIVMCGATIDNSPHFITCTFGQ